MLLFLTCAAEHAKKMFDDGTELAMRAKAGDIAAFETLVKRFEKFVYTTVFFDVRNSEDAYDISQEVFIKLYRSLGTFRGDSAFSSWLYRICKNASYDFLRKNAKVKTVSLSYLNSDWQESDYDLPDGNENANPEQAYEKNELRQRVRDAIETLSGEHREILLLRDIEGYTYAEIADMLALEQGTVKSRISRARDMLRKALTETGML